MNTRKIIFKKENVNCSFEMNKIKEILVQFKKDIKFGYSIELSLSRAWLHAEKTNQFIDKQHLRMFISKMQKLSKHYQTDFFN